jgi:hypothetical protein
MANHCSRDSSNPASTKTISPSHKFLNVFHENETRKVATQELSKLPYLPTSSHEMRSKRWMFKEMYASSTTYSLCSVGKCGRRRGRDLDRKDKTREILYTVRTDHRSTIHCSQIKCAEVHWKSWLCRSPRPSQPFLLRQGAPRLFHTAHVEDEQTRP